MKKTLIAAGIAALVAAPSAMATTIFGDLKYEVQSTDHYDDDDDELSIGGRARLGFTGAEDVAGGLKAVYKIDMQFGDGKTFGATIKDSNPEKVWSFRDVYAGLAGSFGTVIMGRAEAPNTGNDSVVDKFKANSFGDQSQAADRVNNAMAYISPSFEGFNFAVTVVADGSVESEKNDPGKDALDAHDYHVGYTNGPLTIKAGTQKVAMHSPVGSSDITSIGVGYNAGDIYVGAYYDTKSVEQSKATRPAHSLEQYILRGAYRMGNNSIALGYRSLEVIESTSSPIFWWDKTWQLELDHHFSKRTTGYVAYQDWNDGSSDNNGDFTKLSAGLQVKF